MRNEECRRAARTATSRCKAKSEHPALTGESGDPDHPPFSPFNAYL